jgi:hypothetical protein
MSDLLSILRLEHKPVEVSGVRLLLRRPTVADLAEALDVNEKAPKDANPTLLRMHVLNESGVPVFADLEAARQCPVALGAKLVAEIEGLYAEGRS